MTFPSYSLSLSDISAQRGDSLLFSGLKLRVSNGDLVWIQGSNGSGKTTILRMAAGFMTPMAGDINWTLDEKTAGPEEMVAYQGHHDPLDAELTVVQTLKFWINMYDSTADMAKCLSLVGLIAKQNVPCGKLSAGQKRRLILARLIISNRPVWLLDETVAAIDADGVELFDNILSKHLERGGSALLAAHRPAVKIGASASKLVLGAA